jgi:hypothetical protein
MALLRIWWKWGGVSAQKDLGFREVAPAHATSHTFDAITLFGGADMASRCVATSVAGFVQQLAVGYVTHRYYFYITGRIPDHKDPAATDRKLVARYGRHAD